MRAYSSAQLIPLGGAQVIFGIQVGIAQVAGYRELTGQFLGAPRLLRVNEITRPGSYRLDDALQVGLLAELGNQAAKDDEVLRQVKSRYLNGRIALPWRL